MAESPCSLGGGFDSSNHQYPKQTDGAQDTTLVGTTRLRRQVGRLKLVLTVADHWKFASGNWAFSLAPSGSQPQAQSRTHGITGTICT